MHARMRQTSLFTAVAITLAVAFEGTALAQSVGTFKLNLAKSKYQAGQAPKSMTSCTRRRVSRHQGHGRHSAG